MRAPSFANIFRLGIKELWSLVRDPMMLVLIAYTFSISIYVAATAMPESLHKATIAIVDEDDSPLSARIVASFYPPHFTTPRLITLAEMDAGRLDVTVFQNAVGQGEGGIATAIALVRGEPVEQVVWIPYELVTPENYKDYMK